MITGLGKTIRRWRTAFSRSRLVARWLGYDVRQPASSEPGLIVLQLDGLSRQQFEAAMAKGRLPFLRRMIQRHYFRRMSFYSGLPSATPAVQAEVMYGHKCAVPAFQFLHRRSGQVLSMYESESAAKVAEEYLCDHEPLQKGGASYSNIYAGSADDIQGCVETNDLLTICRQLNPLRLLLVLPLYTFVILRIMALAVVEMGLAFCDMVYGVFHHRDWRSEVKFVPARVLISIVLREAVRMACKIAVHRGTPVIYANFLGYDEQSHRRGPSSAFAHWGLKGIDGVFRDIIRTARRSDVRDYEIVVFSDHGQEETVTYESQQGQSIQDAVQEMLIQSPLPTRNVTISDPHSSWGGEMNQRARRLLNIQRGRIVRPELTAEELRENVIVTAMGPLGHIYFPVALADSEKADFAAALVQTYNVPLCLYRQDDGQIRARNRQGHWQLPGDCEHIAGSHHHFIPELKEDLALLLNHPDVGDLVIAGWDPERQPVTFAQEYGSHAGIGTQEVRGFALIPRALNISTREATNGEMYIRGVDLYAASLRFLNRRCASPAECGNADGSFNTQREELRVMTYNTHHCLGIDGKYRPQRIADVIASADVDLVALQEVDDGRARSKFENQSQLIAASLGLYHAFFPVWERHGERYGLAVLSRFPITIMNQDVLTTACSRSRRESRGAIWIRVDLTHGPLYFVNTHFGLSRAERQHQADELLSERWLGGVSDDIPVILAGDFNAGPRSAVMKKLTQRFPCCQVTAEDYRPQLTFPSMLPVRRIDYLLLSHHCAVKSSHVIRNYTTATASDHLPLVAEVTIRTERQSPSEKEQTMAQSQRFRSALRQKFASAMGGIGGRKSG